MGLLTVGLSTLVLLILTHIAVFWVVRTLYPPPPQVVYVPAPVPPMETHTVNVPITSLLKTELPAFTETVSQEVNVPTFEAPVSLEAPSQEGGANFDPNGPIAPAKRDTGLVAPVA
jgi:hypothetical protein